MVNFKKKLEQVRTSKVSKPTRSTSLDLDALVREHDKLRERFHELEAEYEASKAMLLDEFKRRGKKPGEGHVVGSLHARLVESFNVRIDAAKLAEAGVPANKILAGTVKTPYQYVRLERKK